MTFLLRRLGSEVIKTEPFKLWYYYRNVKLEWNLRIQIVIILTHCYSLKE